MFQDPALEVARELVSADLDKLAVQCQRKRTLMGNHIPLRRDPQPAQRPMPVVPVQRNPVPRELPCTNTIVAVVVVQTQLARLPAQTQIQHRLGAVVVHLQPAQVALVADGPALVAAVVAVEALVAEDEAAAGGDDLDERAAVGLGDGAAGVAVARAEFGAVGESDLVPEVGVGPDGVAVAVSEVLWVLVDAEHGGRANLPPW